MGQTFGKRIEQFVMSNDIMDKTVFEDLMNLITRYLQKDLGITHFSLLMEGIVNNKPGLATKWSMGDTQSSYSLPENAEDKCDNYSTYAFSKHVSLWMVRNNQAEQAAEDSWKDLWSNNTEVPIDSGITEDIRTSIRHPIKRHGKAVGVLELASTKYVEPAPVSCDEISKLGEIIERAYAKMDIRDFQKSNTLNVLEQLSKSLDNDTWIRLALPKMFVAFSGGTGLVGKLQKQHEAVIATIREVVADLSGVVDTVFWDESKETGNINLQVIRDLCLAEYGICYFSEPDADGEHPYQDNPNVLFEAGMMQALQNSPGSLLRGWIPIREAASPELPFDIAAERMIIIDRSKDASNTNLALELKGRIENLVQAGAIPIEG